VAHPRTGLAALAGAEQSPGLVASRSAPSRGLSPDTKGPVDLSCRAKGRACVPGAACKARQRTGQAGPAAFAWGRATGVARLASVLP